MIFLAQCSKFFITDDLQPIEFSVQNFPERSNDWLFDCSNDVTDVGINDNLEDDFADDEVSDDEDNLSFDSNITDATWKIDLSDDENEDFASLDTTPTNNNDFKDTIPIVDNISAVDSFDEVVSMPSPPQPIGNLGFLKFLPI